MDRKPQSYTWPFSYPPFSPTPALFTLNGMTYHHFPAPGGGPENITMGLPVVTPWPPPDPRSMTGHRHQDPAQAHQEANVAATAATTTSHTRTPPGPPSNPDTAARPARPDPPAGPLVSSRPASPTMTVDAATQCLASQLRDAIHLCTASLAAHAAAVAAAPFTSAATRNGVLWRDLLAHRFRAGGFAQDGFRNLGERLAFYMDQAQKAAARDLARAGGGGGGMDRCPRKAERRVRRLKVLGAECAEVVGLTRAAAKDARDCGDMLELMVEMKAKLGGGPHRERREPHGEQQQEAAGEEEKPHDGDGSGDGNDDGVPAASASSSPLW